MVSEMAQRLEELSKMWIELWAEVLLVFVSADKLD